MLTFGMRETRPNWPRSEESPLQGSLHAIARCQYSILGLFVLFGLNSSTQVFAQSGQKPDSLSQNSKSQTSGAPQVNKGGSPGAGEPKKQKVGPDVLNLERAIARAYARSRLIQQHIIAYRQAELSYDTAFATMFLPSVSLGLSSSQAGFGIVKLPGSTDPALGTNRGYPTTSAVSLSLGEYRIFNFWKDWLTYESALLSWERQKQVYRENLRAVRFDVINRYFTYLTVQEKLEGAKRSIDIAEAIIESVKSNIRLKKAQSTDLASSIVDLLSAKNDFNRQATQSKASLWSLNEILGDAIDTEYRLEDTIKYTPLAISIEQGLKLSNEYSPSLRGARLALRGSELSLQRAELERLPLPSVSLSGITLQATNAYRSSSPTALTTSPAVSSGYLEVNMSLSFSIPLYGPSGFLNGRTIEQARLSRDSAEISYRDAAFNIERDISNRITQIKQDEKTIENSRNAFTSSSEVLDGLLARMSKGEMSRLELRDAIRQARESQFALNDAILSHLNNKLELAKSIGIDHLPGDVY